MNADHETSQKEWVTPSFEQQPLKDALAGALGNLDVSNGYS